MQRLVHECSLFLLQIGQTLEANPNVLQEFNIIVNNGGGGEVKKDN